MKLILILTTLCSSLYGSELPVPPRLLHAIHQVESEGRIGAIKGVNGELGPFQIRPIYWWDSGVPGSFEQCADYRYSVLVITAIMNKYAHRALETNNFETIARIHNGGPNGRHKKSTYAYWQRVKRQLTQN